MKTGWSVEAGREDLFERLAGLAKTGNFREYLRLEWDDYGIFSLWQDELLVFGADVFLGGALEELASFNFYLLGLKPLPDIGELRTGKLRHDPYRRALAGGSFDAFLEEHVIVSLGSYDPRIDLHMVREGETLKVLSLGWYGRSQELYFEVSLDEWLDSTVGLFAMVVGDFARMRETLLRYGFSDAPRRIGRYRALLRLLLDAHPIDVDALPPAYAPWEVEEVVRTASELLSMGSAKGVRCVIDTLLNTNHYRLALSKIHNKPEVLEELYRALDELYRSEMLAHLSYLYAVERKPDEGLRIAEELESDACFHDLALGMIQIEDYETAMDVAGRIENPWPRGEILMRLYSERPELEERIKEIAPEHARVFIEEWKKRAS